MSGRGAFHTQTALCYLEGLHLLLQVLLHLLHGHLAPLDTVLDLLGAHVLVIEALGAAQVASFLQQSIQR